MSLNRLHELRPGNKNKKEDDELFGFLLKTLYVAISGILFALDVVGFVEYFWGG